MQKQLFIIFLVSILTLGGIFLILNFVKAPTVKEYNYNKFKIESSDFKEGDFIPTKYTCDGLNINPSLKILNIPIEAKSLMLVLEDENQKVGWLVWNISIDKKEILSGESLEKAVEGLNDFDKKGYSGPCKEEKKIKEYKIVVYALDYSIDRLSDNTDKNKINNLISSHILAKDILNFKY